MRKFKLTRISGAGDELVAEWTETTDKTRLEEIEKEFNEKMKEGYFAANLETNDTAGRAFDQQTGICLRLIREYDIREDLIIGRIDCGWVRRV